MWWKKKKEEKKDRTYIKTKTVYPKWKHLVPELPSEEQFREAFKNIFDSYPEECKYDWDEESGSFTCSSSTTAHYHGGIMCEYTEDPQTDGDLYYPNCGCDWSVDSVGMRYVLIDKTTGEIHDKEEYLNQHIIRNYVLNSTQIQRERKLEELLD